MSEFETIRVEADGGVRWITLNRPERKNAMSRAMVRELRAASEEIDDETRVVVLRGAGGTFCSGGDLEEMAGARSARVEGGVDPIAALNAEFGHLARHYAELPVPVVAALEGAVMGGGFGLACVADLTLASPDVRFRLPEAGLGLLPAQIAPFLVQRIGYAATLRVALSGETLDAEQAVNLGLVHEVWDALDAGLEQTLTGIFSAAPGAARSTKALLRELAPRAVSPATIERAATLFAECARGAEAAEGIGAFLGKRKPKWAKR